MTRRRLMGRIVWTFHLLGLTGLLTCLGCEDIDWDWELQEWNTPRRPIRPSRPPAPTTRQADRTRIRTEPSPEAVTPPDEQKRWSIPRPTDAGEERAAAPPPPSRDQRQYYQLYLVSGQVSLRTPPNSKKIVLEQAPSRVVADLLQLIYPSIGPSGAEDQRFLVYQYEPMWTAASEFVHLLDCPETAQPPPADPGDPVVAIKTGVGFLYHLNKPGQRTDFAGYKRVRRLMEVAMNSDQASGQARWGSAMLAGRVCAEILSQYADARKYFELALGYALPGSVEEMVAAYCVAETYRRQGQRQQAARLAEALVKKFAAHRDSHIYEQAVEMAKTR